MTKADPPPCQCEAEERIPCTMCGRYNAHTLTDLLVELFELPAAVVQAEPPRYNIAPSQTAPVVRMQAGAPILDHQQWGIVPGWPGAEAQHKRLINARMETAHSKPAFADAFAHRRCLIPANGYYEWTSEPGSKHKQPWHIHLPGWAAFLMAGIWQPQPSPGNPLGKAFAVITQPPLTPIAPIHDRMPTIVSATQAYDWLAGAPAATPSDAAFQAEPVSTRLNSPRVDGPELLQAVAIQPASSQGTLF